MASTWHQHGINNITSDMRMDRMASHGRGTYHVSHTEEKMLRWYAIRTISCPCTYASSHAICLLRMCSSKQKRDYLAQKPTPKPVYMTPSEYETLRQHAGDAAPVPVGKLHMCVASCYVMLCHVMSCHVTHECAYSVCDMHRTRM